MESEREAYRFIKFGDVLISGLFWRYINTDQVSSQVSALLEVVHVLEEPLQDRIYYRFLTLD